MTGTLRILKMTGAVLVAVAALFLVAPQHEALAAPSEARVALESTINQVLAELNKPELKNPATRSAVLNKIELIIRSLFSFEELSMRTVGPKWRSFSPDQRKRFIEAFEDLLRERYLSSLEGYNGETVNYLGENSGAKGDKVEIQTAINIQNKVVPVSYRMLQKGRWLVYDVVIEGVSMVQNYRSQFQSVLDKGDADQLITLVRQKADETRAEKNKK